MYTLVLHFYSDVTVILYFIDIMYESVMDIFAVLVMS